VEEVFCRRLLGRLHRAERLSEEFHRSLLSWATSGFSVHGEQRAPAEAGQGAEGLARYLTRGPVVLDVVARTERGERRAVTRCPTRTPASRTGSSIP